MSKKILSVTATLALAAVVAFSAPAGARGPAKSTVTIIPESGGFFGYVFSPKPQKCANGRLVKLYKQRGARQNPRTDTKIASDTASPNGARFMWATGNTGFSSGKFYARVGKLPGCKPDSSKSIPAQR